MNETKKTMTGKHFVSETVTLDGRGFVDCTFDRCRLVYAGGLPPGLSGCRFEGCTWEFDEAAARTLQFLTGLYHGGFQTVIESTFASIRATPTQPAGAPPAPGPTGPAAAFARRLAEFPPIRIVKRPKPKPGAD